MYDANGFREIPHVPPVKHCFTIVSIKGTRHVICTFSEFTDLQPVISADLRTPWLCPEYDKLLDKMYADL